MWEGASFSKEPCGQIKNAEFYHKCLNLACKCLGSVLVRRVQLLSCVKNLYSL